jgi:DNA polymerase-3 subunit delta
MEALTFLENPAKTPPQPVYVLVGDESFLKRHALKALRELLLGSEDNPFGWSVLAGDKTSWSAVHADLTTLPFLGSRRVVVVDGADPFVTAAREKLEVYVGAPSATGVLILDVKTWPSNTRLAKMLPDKATFVCKAPATQRLPAWCQHWCQAQHGKSLSAETARLLVDLVGADMGLLDQELAKLAVFVGDRKKIEPGDVDQLVGHSREESVWKIFDLIGVGQTAAALTLLDRLFTQGEEPLALLGAMASKLRGFAKTYRLTTVGKSVSEAMDEAGIPTYPVARNSAEGAMRHLGARRLNLLYDWLVQTNEGMKGGSQLPPRAQMERLVIQLARK